MTFDFRNISKGFLINFTFTLIKEVKLIWDMIEVRNKGAGNSYSKTISYKIKECDIRKVAKTNFLFKGFLANFEKSANFRFECPMKKVQMPDLKY